MTTSYLSISEFPGDGVTTEWEFNFAGGYISRDHVLAYIKSDVGVITPYDITSSFISDFKISVTPAVPVGSTLRVYRDTPREEPIVNFTGGSNFTEANLDLLARQTIFAVAEAFDAGSYAVANDLLGAAEAALVAANAAEVVAAAQAGISTTKAGEASASAALAAANSDAARASALAALAATTSDAALAENILINGRMWLVPDGVSTWTSPASGTYMLGLWNYLREGTTAQLNAARVGGGHVNCPLALQFTCTTAQATMGAAHVAVSEQVLESLDCQEYIGKTFTVRGRITSDVSGVVPVYIRNWAVTHAYVFPVSVVGGVETEFEHTIVGGLTAAAVWGAGPGSGGLRIGVCLAAGSTYHTPTPGAWAAGAYVGIAGQVNAVGAVNRKLSFTDMSMVLGTAKPQSTDYRRDAARMAVWYQSIRVYWSGYTAPGVLNSVTATFPDMRMPPNVTVGYAGSSGPATVPFVAAAASNTAILQSYGNGLGPFVSDIVFTLSTRY